MKKIKWQELKYLTSLHRTLRSKIQIKNKKILNSLESCAIITEISARTDLQASEVIIKSLYLTALAELNETNEIASR